VCDSRRLERPLDVRNSAGPLGDQKGDGLVFEPASSEGDRVRRRPIEPLDVVDGDQHRPPGGERTQRVQKTERNRTRFGRLADRLCPEQRNLERALLRGRQTLQTSKVGPIEQVDQGGEREPGLGVARTGGEDVNPSLARRDDGSFPERGLADPWPAGQDESPRAFRGQELVQRRQFRLSPDQTCLDASDDCQRRPPKPLDTTGTRPATTARHETRVAPVVPDLPPMELGYARTPLRRKLVEAVLRGDKTATAGLHGDEPLPQAGDRFLLLDYDDEPVAVVETTEVRVLRVDEVDLQFARDEGEGFETVADWREAHERFWADREIRDDTLIVAERFRLVERLTTRSGG
jgi:uncharacterized protein YhfF